VKKLTIKTYPDPCLRIKTKTVEKFDDDLKGVVKSMLDLMYIHQGIGLAATQVGLGLSLFVMDFGEGPVTFVNPETIGTSGKKTRMEEGCLSLPGVTVSVARPEKVEVRAQDENGGFFIKVYDSLAAKVVQHESDHLKGRLIIDYLDPVRYFFAQKALLSKKKDHAEGKCEVVCHVGKRDSRKA
jgi:peptide deformylase